MAVRFLTRVCGVAPGGEEFEGRARERMHGGDGDQVMDRFLVLLETCAVLRLFLKRGTGERAA